MADGIIYCATLIADGRVYVGKTSLSLEGRCRAHLKAVRRGSGTYFHSALRKYGPDAFQWAILERCPQESLNEREKAWICELRAMEVGFNLRPGGTGEKPSLPARAAISAANKGRKMTPEQIERCRSARWDRPSEELAQINAKIASTLSGRQLPEVVKAKLRGRKASVETRAKMSEAQKGHPGAVGWHHTDETKAQMSASRTGKRRGPMSEETRRKISEAKKGCRPWNKRT